MLHEVSGTHRRVTTYGWPNPGLPITTRSTMSPVSTAAATARTVLTRASLVDRYATTADLFKVQAFDGLFSLLFVRHFHKTKPARSARLTVLDDAHRRYLTEPFERVL